MTTLTKPALKKCRFVKQISDSDYTKNGYYIDGNEIGWITHQLYDFLEEDSEYCSYKFTDAEIGEDIKSLFGLTDKEIKNLWETNAIRVEEDAILLVLQDFESMTSSDISSYRKHPHFHKQKSLFYGLSPQVNNIYLEWDEDMDGEGWGNTVKRVYSIEMLSDIWKESLWAFYDFDPDKHNDDDELPWTLEEVKEHQKTSLIWHYNSCFGTDIDPEDVKEDEWELGNGDWETGWFIAPIKKEDTNE